MAVRRPPVGTTAYRDTRPLTGRSFSTALDVESPPVWEPLEAVARMSRSSDEHPSFHEWEFMYMSAVVRRDGVRIHLYKHRDTRRYLNLDESGQAYAYCWRPTDGLDADDGGRYRRYASLAAAIDHVELWLFEEHPSFFRSCPPAMWPPDPPVVALVPDASA